MQVKPPIKQPPRKGVLRQALVLIETRASRAYPEGIAVLRKTLGAPADRDVCGTGFSCSLSHVIEIARFYWSTGAPVLSGFA